MKSKQEEKTEKLTDDENEERQNAELLLYFQ